MDFAENTLVRGLRSTQILMFPDFLGTTTIPAHHGVGTSTLEITPMASILASCLVTLGLRGRAMLQGVESAYAIASGFNVMLNGSAVRLS